MLLLLCFLGREKHLWFYNLSCTKLSCLRQPSYCMFNTELCTVAILKLNSGCWCLQQNLGGINDSWLIVQEKISPFVHLTPFSTNGSEAILWYKTKQLEMHWTLYQWIRKGQINCYAEMSTFWLVTKITCLGFRAGQTTNSFIATLCNQCD